MSWDCPHLIDDKCNLNNTTCVPTKGKCVLKGRFLTAEQMIQLKKRKPKDDVNEKN